MPIRSEYYSVGVIRSQSDSGYVHIMILSSWGLYINCTLNMNDEEQAVSNGRVDMIFNSFTCNNACPVRMRPGTFTR